MWAMRLLITIKNGENNRWSHSLAGNGRISQSLIGTAGGLQYFGDLAWRDTSPEMFAPKNSDHFDSCDDTISENSRA